MRCASLCALMANGILITAYLAKIVFRKMGSLDDLLELDEAEGNQITLIVIDDIGHFILNEEYIAQLDLSEREPSAGNLALGTGFYSSSEQEGFATTL